MLASFDIFDTTLIRKSGTPQSVFWLTAQRLFPQDAPLRQSFYAWRCHAEADVQRQIRQRLVTLDDIYRHEALARFAPYTAEEMMLVEMSMEGEQLTLVPEVGRLIESYRSEGWSIAFISDMYLPEAFLRQVLLREGAALPEDAVYVSAAHNATKGSGALYRIVRDALRPDRWIHYGDNRHSDGLMARAEGIEAHTVDFGRIQAEEVLAWRLRHTTYRHDIEVLTGYQRAWRLLHPAKAVTPEGLTWVEQQFQGPRAAFDLWKREAQRMSHSSGWIRIQWGVMKAAIFLSRVRRRIGGVLCHQAKG